VNDCDQRAKEYRSKSSHYANKYCNDRKEEQIDGTLGRGGVTHGVMSFGEGVGEIVSDQWLRASAHIQPCLRVDRGSSWYYPPWLLRSAVRERNPADYRDIMMGFRVAKALP
jgi:formylglycine-generating enzyme required for sulfatase activity